MAARLLLGRTPLDPDSVYRSPSLRAVLAYDAGEEALATWNLDAAAEQFALAAERDSAFAAAYLRLTQVLAWSGDTTQVWRDAARRADLLRSRLSEADRPLAAGFSALAERRYPDACDSFTRTLEHDPQSFAAWYGLGDCQAWDPIVVSDTSSPSGWSFRSCYHAAIQAYRRALELVPSFNFAFRHTAYERLTRLLYVESHRFRSGHLADDVTTVFAADAGLEADTIAYYPVPWQQWSSSTAPSSVPNTEALALAYNRRVLVDLTADWARAFPRSADAHYTLALALERLGEIDAPAAGRRSASTALQRALADNTDPVLDAIMRAMSVRLSLKRGAFADAAGEARVLIEQRPDTVGGNAARALAGVAAVAGQVHEAAELWTLARLPSLVALQIHALTPPAPLVDDLLALEVYAAFAAPRDSVLTLWARAERGIEQWLPPPQRLAARVSLLEVPAVLAANSIGATTLHDRNSDWQLLRLQRAVFAGDAAAAREILRTMTRYRDSVGAGALSPFLTRGQAQAHLALGDTASAIGVLDDVLGGLHMLRMDVLNPRDVPALIAMMELRASLAFAAGDRNTAARWAQRVTVLWQDADPELRPRVTEMQRIVRWASDTR
ncbi:MAG: hypothetical protein ACRELD_09590 [Longimicrobiales bacterium]